MKFIIETFGQIAVLLVSGAVLSFVVWKLKKRKSDFGVFVSKYGELLAYAGIFLVFIIITIIQLLSNPD